MPTTKASAKSTAKPLAKAPAEASAAAPETKKFTKRSLPAEVKAAVTAALEKQGEGILALDLRQTASFTDFFVIMNGRSSRQNQALAEAVEAALRGRGLRPIGVEGTAHAEWILLDYGSFVVHVFSPAAREYYGLERLWGDAPKVSY